MLLDRFDWRRVGIVVEGSRVRASVDTLACSSSVAVSSSICDRYDVDDDDGTTRIVCSF